MTASKWSTALAVLMVSAIDPGAAAAQASCSAPDACFIDGACHTGRVCCDSQPWYDAWIVREFLAPTADDTVDMMCDVEFEYVEALAAHRGLSFDGPVLKSFVFAGSQDSNLTLDCGDDPTHPIGALGNQVIINVDTVRTPLTPTCGAAWDGVEAQVWDRPEGVTIRNCTLYGRIRIRGMIHAVKEGGTQCDVLESSRRQGHVDRIRAAAPTRTTIENVTFRGEGMIPLYVNPGVTYTQVIGSHFYGSSGDVAIYLDAESSHNVIRDSVIDTATGNGREQIAIDGSSYNHIHDNWIGDLQRGGIFVYRNCGEDGMVRISEPSHNVIVWNIFPYLHSDTDDPAVYLGGRHDDWDTDNYCNEDEGVALWGSSIDDRQFARHNIVAYNQVWNRSPTEMIRAWNDASNTPNYVYANSTCDCDFTTMSCGLICQPPLAPALIVATVL
ncbi:right-handed parallel beta-helix repeat-containing protein [Sandaracinus amylolyticus]|uniref:right-handed parallel beta-helix repeat-containing protein n=1 Tax=Sandaracinus amylolyticus TaxID=927083 RepID=UPI001F21AE0E|nr:right-handed parallel beta-helix repeat-containing protein [Sandaracinus amylolyticus]UJR84233.1 Hypothetical protein I5071_63050 [Sandaracinus amylolyticus]